MSGTRIWPIGAVVAVLIAVTGRQVGEQAQRRLSDHRGFQLVAAELPAVPPPPPAVVPRRVFVVIIDGLRRDVARTLPVMARLAETGRCVPTHVPVPTVSQPVYASISTGVRPDRHGVRTNGRKDPVAAESIWAVARAAGFEVVGVSELDWWQKLFPDGFTRFEVRPRTDDYFAVALALGGDLILVHPLYVDEAGHDHGAASREYAEAAARASRELGALLDAVDLARDLVVVTADHGHTAHGGHGGAQPEVSETLTCLAGAGADALADPQEPADLARLIAAAMRLPAPRHAGEPGWLDMELAKASAKVLARLVGCLLTIVAGAVLLLRARRLGLRGGAASAAWIVGVAAAHVALYVAVRGSFDGTSINARGEFINAALLVGFGAGAVGAAAHLAIFRSLARARFDHLMLAALGLAIDLSHAVSFGWPVGWPMPGAELLFLPFFSATFIVTHAIIAVLLALTPQRRRV